MLDSKKFNPQSIRSQFPIFEHNPNLIYLDNASTTQKPLCVIKSITDAYSKNYANVHRGQHSMTRSISEEYENARHIVSNFINAHSPNEIVWTRNTTESLNLVAHCLGEYALSEGDEIILGTMEHHSNIVPWQQIAKKYGAIIKYIPITQDANLDLNAYQTMISKRTKIVSIAHVTNVTTTRQPIEAIIEIAKKYHAYTVIDGAQGIVKEPIDVQNLDVDFYAFSGHKIYGPTGIGVLYGKKSLLEKLPPYQSGGKMVEYVSFEHTVFESPPHKFEAGTPNAIGAIALACAIKWFTQYRWEDKQAHINSLQKLAYEELNKIENIKFIGYQANSHNINFLIEGCDIDDLAMLLDQQNILLRHGLHCVHPLMDEFDIDGTLRLSLALFNTKDDITHMINALKKSITLL